MCEDKVHAVDLPFFVAAYKYDENGKLTSIPCQMIYKDSELNELIAKANKNTTQHGN